MCTLIVATHAFSDTPLLVAANRDEALDRPAAGPTVRAVGPRRALAPTDLVAGGTWLGVNDRGVLVAITNRFGVPVDHARASRGHLVTAALAHGTAKDAYEALREVDGAGQNGFHLLMADAEGAFLTWGDGARLYHQVLQPGLHIITERSFHAAGAPAPREALIQRLAPTPGGPAPEEAVWQRLLTTRAEPSYDGVVVRWPERNYGTRSASFVRLGPAPRFLHAPGPPDEAPFEDHTEALVTLLGR